MATSFHCDIASAEDSIFSGEVESLVAAGSLGDLGIYPGHAPLLTALIPGPVRIVMAVAMKIFIMCQADFWKFSPGKLIF